MKREGHIWFLELKQYVETCRLRRPIPSIRDLSPVEAARSRIVGGSLFGWLRGHGQELLQARKGRHRQLNVEPDPYIVFTSNMSGLVAAKDIFAQVPTAAVCLREDEYRRWLCENGEDGFRWHLHAWSFFPPIAQPEFIEKAQAHHPLTQGAYYWQQCEGAMLADAVGRGGDHLWQWDGDKARLLRRLLAGWILNGPHGPAHRW